MERPHELKLTTRVEFRISFCLVRYVTVDSSLC